MNYLNVEASQHEMRLIQMGAKVEQINSKMCYVKFLIEGIQVGYVYNLNKKNEYFLERIEPYPLPVRAYGNIQNVVDVIEVDIKQFRNAVKSSNIESFVEINKDLLWAVKKFEDLFLYYNIPADQVSAIKQKVKEIHEEIMKTKDTAERVFFDKEPDNLK